MEVLATQTLREREDIFSKDRLQQSASMSFLCLIRSGLLQHSLVVLYFVLSLSLYCIGPKSKACNIFWFKLYVFMAWLLAVFHKMLVYLKKPRLHVISLKLVC